MTKTLRLINAAMMLLFSFALAAQATQTDSIREAVARQLRDYPQSTLRDIYKNFFQDNFGPGHLLADRDAAERYLRSELADTTVSRCRLYEPTGYRSNYYRVDLRVIKENRVTFGQYFDAFCRSMAEVTPVDVEKWKKEWQTIIAVIDSMNAGLENYAEDKAEIARLLDRGDYVMHHSRRFESAYSPHYRIISAAVFDRELRLLIDGRP